MNRFYFFALIFISSSVLSQSEEYHNQRLPVLTIENDNNLWVPLRATLEEESGKSILTIHNHDEKIVLPQSHASSDTNFYKFTDYNSEIALIKSSTDEVKSFKNVSYIGYWIDYEAEFVKRRPLIIYNQVYDSTRVRLRERVNERLKIEGNWKTEIFLPNRSYPAVITIEQNRSHLFGTMRTKSGDYRFLQGRLRRNNFYLSAFNGRSLTYIMGEVRNDSLIGSVMNATASRNFVAVLDNNFDLPDDKTITKVINDKYFQLNLPDENGKKQNFKRLIRKKVALVNIFGTWCPNCIDEVTYLNNEFKKEFPEVEIICIAFEATNDPIEQANRIKRFKERKNNDLTFLIGGKADRENVLEKFPMINEISAYPTSFVLDKNGDIVQIHTGFNGPATGIYFEKFKEELRAVVGALLLE